MVIFTKEIMEADKPVPVANIPPMRFIGGPTNYIRTGSIQISWDLEISVAEIIKVGVPLEKDLVGNGMKSRNLVIHMECDGEASWVLSLKILCPTQSLDQWVGWITYPPLVEEILNIDCLILVFPDTNKN